MSYLEDRFRMCKFCHKNDFVYRALKYHLVKYSTRCYAHWHCLVKHRGLIFALSRVPAHQQQKMRDEQPPALGFFGEEVRSYDDQ